jgi:hypothetical protein
MVISTGSRLGPYEIVSPLGAGGMGEVYRARDARLGRQVAMKVLPAEVAGDASRLKRFEKEARAGSALNHPNIVTIYEIGSAEGISFIAMEKVESRTLRELIFAGPLPNKKLLGRIVAPFWGGLLLCCLALGQTTTGNIEGTVRDTSRNLCGPGGPSGIPLRGPLGHGLARRDGDHRLRTRTRVERRGRRDG